MGIKVLEVTVKDLDGYGDWLIGPMAEIFESGDYTHIRVDGEDFVVECDVVGKNSSGESLVVLGEANDVNEN